MSKKKPEVEGGVSDPGTPPSLSGPVLPVEMGNMSLISQIFETTPTAILATDATGVIQVSNQQARNLLGVKALPGEQLFTLLALPDWLAEGLLIPGQTRAFTAAYSTTASLQQYFRVVVQRVEHLDGGHIVELHRQSTSTSMRQGQFLEHVVQQLQDLVDNSSTLMYIKDLEGRYLMINRLFAEVFGLPVEQVVGRRDEELYPPHIAQIYANHDREVITKGESFEYEEPIVGMSDSNREVGDGSWLSIKFPLRDSAGSVYALGGISTNISDRKRAEAAAEQARLEAERANEAKNDFLSRVSHELRTPLNAVIGFGQLLQASLSDTPQQVSIAHILDAAAHLLDLVNDILDFTWIEAGKPGMSQEVISVAGPLREAIELARPLASKRDIELVSDLHAGLFAYVRADTRRLRQVFINLLANGIKFNHAGGALRIVCEQQEDQIAVRLIDTGPGITASDIPHLFQPFMRLEAHEARTEGTGLGLSLSRELIRGMGGEVELEYTGLGEGSVFRITLPLVENIEEIEAIPMQPHLLQIKQAPHGSEKFTVLYIEDMAANVELVAEITKRMGDFELLVASTGKVGLMIAGDQVPNLILLDLHLSDMTGETVLDALKEDPRMRDIPVIVLTADVTPSRVAVLENRGISGFLSKPLDIELFSQMLRRSVR